MVRVLGKSETQAAALTSDKDFAMTNDKFNKPPAFSQEGVEGEASALIGREFPFNGKIENFVKFKNGYVYVSAIETTGPTTRWLATEFKHDITNGNHPFDKDLVRYFHLYIYVSGQPTTVFSAQYGSGTIEIDFSLPAGILKSLNFQCAFKKEGGSEVQGNGSFRNVSGLIEEQL